MSMDTWDHGREVSVKHTDIIYIHIHIQAHIHA